MSDKLAGPGEAYNDGMRIFLAGASGVIGQRLIPRLVRAGHVVGGLTRSPSKTELLSHLENPGAKRRLAIA